MTLPRVQTLGMIPYCCSMAGLETGGGELDIQNEMLDEVKLCFESDSVNQESPSSHVLLRRKMNASLMKICQELKKIVKVQVSRSLVFIFWFR